MDLQLRGKRALVTGGSRGIGRAITLALARHGVSVAACYRQEGEAARSLASELQQFGGSSFTMAADVSDELGVARLAERVLNQFDQLDVLVNNAGTVSHNMLTDMTLQDWRRLLDTNLTAMFLVTRAVHLAIPAGGSIVNVGSAVASVGMPGRTHYTASKAGVVGFTRSLCKELGPRRIRVNAVAPGIIDTDQASGLTAEQRSRYANLAALARLGEPDDVAAVVLFLASDLSRFVSGVTLNVDGGI